MCLPEVLSRKILISIENIKRASAPIRVIHRLKAPACHMLNHARNKKSEKIRKAARTKTSRCRQVTLAERVLVDGARHRTTSSDASTNACIVKFWCFTLQNPNLIIRHAGVREFRIYFDHLCFRNVFFYIATHQNAAAAAGIEPATSS